MLWLGMHDKKRNNPWTGCGRGQLTGGWGAGKFYWDICWAGRLGLGANNFKKNDRADLFRDKINDGAGDFLVKRWRGKMKERGLFDENVEAILFLLLSQCSLPLKGKLNAIHLHSMMLSRTSCPVPYYVLKFCPTSIYSPQNVGAPPTHTHSTPPNSHTHRQND